MKNGKKMAILRCTKKLLTEIKISPIENEELSDDFGSWHCNLLRIDRRKCVLFTHDKTLYSFLVPGVTKPDFLNFIDVFRESLFKNLLGEEIPQAQIERFLDNNRKIEIAKTNNRSVLGSMNDLTFQIKFITKNVGGLNNVNFLGLNHEINRIPMSAIKEICSIDELRRFLGIPVRYPRIAQDAKMLAHLNSQLWLRKNDKLKRSRKNSIEFTGLRRHISNDFRRN